MKGVSGSISVVVDGDAPEIDDVFPGSGAVTKDTTVNVRFSISDNGSGIRYDEESGNSADPDLTPHNGDNDQRFDEPLTAFTDARDLTADPPNYGYGNGSTEDITIYYTGTVDEAYNPQAVDENGVKQTQVDATDPNVTLVVLEDGTTIADTATIPEDVGDLNVGLAKNQSAKWGATTDASAIGTNDWTQETKGVEYSLDMDLTGNGFGRYYWQVTAKDRVGNSYTTDGDEDERGKQPFSFNVDNDKPKIADEDGARTGIAYEPGVGEYADRAWIALYFENEKNGGADRIDASTVQPTDFTVEGRTVMNALVPSDKEDCTGEGGQTKSGEPIEALSGDCLTDPGARIYLQLTEDLDSDEEPTIQLLGGVFKDVAGNNNVTDSFEAEDNIAPGVTIDITSSSGTTNRVATDKKGSFTVRVSSDEDLSRFPRLYFTTIEGTAFAGSRANNKNLVVGDVSDEYTMNEVDTDTWERKVDVDHSGLQAVGGTTDRIMAIVITATDGNGNSGNSAGWTDGDDANGEPNDGEKLDFKKLDAGGFLVEVDSVLERAKISVLPAEDPDEEESDATESSNPYIQIDFEDFEVNEYGIEVFDDGGTTAEMETWPDGVDTATYEHEADDREGTATSVDIGDGDSLRIDSHRGVTLTALAIDGVDYLDSAVRVEPWKYVLAVTGFEVGEYEITYAAMDDVGNEVDEDDASFPFEVLERQPYEVEINPGWNLISFPGNPLDTTVGAVISGDLRVDTVLGFQGGEWVTAVRNDDGRWMGTLGDIVGGYGYWVRTTVVETIETVIPPVRPDLVVLPSVPIVAGWNLVGVIDLEQRDAGTGHNVDQYLTSLGRNWRVAYSFETQQNSWAKLLPGATQNNEVQNGKGYWLWNTAPGTLVP